MLYSFDEYELDLQRYELRYAGKRVKLEPQVFNVLVYLIQHRHRVVTKEELLEQLWPGRFGAHYPPGSTGAHLGGANALAGPGG